jgi:hypothetical protein
MKGALVGAYMPFLGGKAAFREVQGGRIGVRPGQPRSFPENSNGHSTMSVSIFSQLEYSNMP